MSDGKKTIMVEATRRITEEQTTRRIEELPESRIKRFFQGLDTETRRIIVSDESLLESSNEHLEKSFNRLVEAINTKFTKPNS